MSKTFKMILLVVAVVVIAIAVPYILPALAPAFAAGGVAAAGVALSTLGMIVSAVLVTGLTMLAQMLLGPKPPKINQAMNDRLNALVNPIAPRKIVFGKTAAGADVRFEEKVAVGTTTDDKPDWYYQVLALASHKITSIQGVYLEDELSSTNGTFSTGKYASGVQFQSCLEGNSTNGSSWGSGSFWTSTATFTGCAYLKTRYLLDQKIWGGGIPSRITTIVEGCPVFDPRLSTVCGGSGPMLPNDQSTWKYYNSTDEIGRNPACVMATYLLGYKIGGKFVWGMQIPSARIDWGNLITYANVCDEAVTTNAGNVKRYQCDGIFDTNMTHESIIAAISASMGTTKLVDTSGLYQFVGGHDDTAGPILSLSADDVVGPYEWTPSQPSRERYNIVSGRYASPADLYQLKDWGRIELDALPDGINRTQNMDFAAVSRPETCQRIAKQMLLKNQVMGQFTANFGPKAFAAQVGSLINLSLPGEGWNNKLFRVIEQTETIDLIFSMILQEENSGIYAWDKSETIALPPNIRVPSYNPTEVASVLGLSAAARQVNSSTGGIESYVDVSWTVPTVLAAAIQIETKESSGTVWQSIASNFEPSSGGPFSFRAPAGGVSTDVRARFRMQSGAFGPWATTTLTAATGGAVNMFNGYLTDESVTFAADSGGTIL